MVLTGEPNVVAGFVSVISHAWSYSFLRDGPWGTRRYTEVGLF
jgi:hypothetical protein